MDDFDRLVQRVIAHEVPAKKAKGIVTDVLLELQLLSKVVTHDVDLAINRSLTGGSSTYLAACMAVRTLCAKIIAQGDRKP